MCDQRLRIISSRTLSFPLPKTDDNSLLTPLLEDNELALVYSCIHSNTALAAAGLRPRPRWKKRLDLS